MKSRYLVACFFVVGGIVFFLMRPSAKPKVNGQQSIRSAVSEKVREFPAEEAGITNGPLAGAYQMAMFIDQFRNSLPSERRAERDVLKSLQAFFFVSDYVMAAKTNRSLILSKAAIITAFTNISRDTSSIKSKLTVWAERPGTLTDHYQSISEVPEEKDHIQAIKAAMMENSVVIDTESDLLMDCIRYAAEMTVIHDMYGPRVKGGSSYPEALSAFVGISDTVFRHRFVTKFGLHPDTVTNLMSRLKEIRISELSPADGEIPARFR